MKIPFSIDQFLNVFGNYNNSVWPAQIGLYVLSAVSLISIFLKWKHASRIVFSILSFFWIWMGLIYHILYFSPINKAAYGFGTLFIVQGLIFLYAAIKNTIQLKFNLRLDGRVGLFLIAYALLLYPLLSYVGGHLYPRTPTFGVPCPTTIFTFGILLFSSHRVSWYVIIIPFLWSLVGFSAALNLQIREDFGLVVAGVLSTAILVLLKPKHETSALRQG